jgi:hypothetical protein
MIPIKNFHSDISFDFSQIFWEASGPTALSDELPVPSANPRNDAVSNTEHHTPLTYNYNNIYI